MSDVENIFPAQDSRSIAFVNRHAPHGSIFALEGLEVVLLGAAFDQQVRLIFVDDGVFQLKRDQNTAALGVKNFSRAFPALELYELQRIVVERESMLTRGLELDDLLIDVEVCSTQQIAELLDDSDVIIAF